jgi:hypothetical protein
MERIKSEQHNVHKILIIGDSHARDAADNVQHNLATTFGTSGFVSPGAPVSSIISSMTSVIKHLSSKDVLVLWGAANDIYTNNSWDALKYIANFIGENKHTNVIILCVPHSHDLPVWSCVNIGIKAFNRTLAKFAKLHNHVTVVKVDLGRNFHTRHGQHMNQLGKEQIALRLASVITDMFSTQEEIVTLHRKDDSEASSSGVSDTDAVSMQEDLTATTPRQKATKGILEVARQDNRADSDSDTDSDPLGQTHDLTIIGAQEDETTYLIQAQDVINSMNSDDDSNPLGQTHDIPTAGEDAANTANDVKTEQSEKIETKQGSQENITEVEERVPSQGCMDDNKKEAVMVVTQMEVVNTNTEILIQETNERVSENSENKKVIARGRLVSDSVVMQIRKVMIWIQMWHKPLQPIPNVIFWTR